MYIAISDLVSYRQYTAIPPVYCFDRKKYRFADFSRLSSQNSEPYLRYIPLFRIDQNMIEEEFLLGLHDKQLLCRYHASNICLEEFAQQNHLWRQWWDHYESQVKQIAIQWCEENNINYRIE